MPALFGLENIQRDISSYMKREYCVHGRGATRLVAPIPATFQLREAALLSRLAKLTGTTSQAAARATRLSHQIHRIHIDDQVAPRNSR